ncbi:MAG: hypothetical protein NT089_04460 [Planctomycetia bacterium]|nr:hypothetical protein [Planctomycetia bacterium]
MSDLELIDAVAKKTGESLREIGRRGFILTGPEDAGADLDTECMLDLVDSRKRARSIGMQWALGAVSRSISRAIPGA